MSGSKKVRSLVKGCTVKVSVWQFFSAKLRPRTRASISSTLWTVTLYLHASAMTEEEKQHTRRHTHTHTHTHRGQGSSRGWRMEDKQKDNFSRNMFEYLKAPPPVTMMLWRGSSAGE